MEGQKSVFNYFQFLNDTIKMELGPRSNARAPKYIDTKLFQWHIRIVKKTIQALQKFVDNLVAHLEPKIIQYECYISSCSA